MSDMKDLRDGLDILLKYKQPGVDGNCDAQHDELFASGPPPDSIKPSDLKMLNKLGWRWDAEVESWALFT